MTGIFGDIGTAFNDIGSYVVNRFNTVSGSFTNELNRLVDQINGSDNKKEIIEKLNPVLDSWQKSTNITLDICTIALTISIFFDVVGCLFLLTLNPSGMVYLLTGMGLAYLCINSVTTCRNVFQVIDHVSHYINPANINKIRETKNPDPETLENHPIITPELYKRLTKGLIHADWMGALVLERMKVDLWFALVRDK